MVELENSSVYRVFDLKVTYIVHRNIHKYIIYMLYIDRIRFLLALLRLILISKPILQKRLFERL